MLRCIIMAHLFFVCFIYTVLDEVKQNVPLYVYIVAGVGGCSVIMLLMFIVIVVKLCKRHRLKKDMQRVFRVRESTSHASCSKLVIIPNPLLFVVYMVHVLPWVACASHCIQIQIM